MMDDFIEYATREALDRYADLQTTTGEFFGLLVVNAFVDGAVWGRDYKTDNEEQIEAGAIALMASQTNFAAGSNPTENDKIDAWKHLPEGMQDGFRARAKTVLDAARKAVAE